MGEGPVSRAPSAPLGEGPVSRAPSAPLGEGPVFTVLATSDLHGARVPELPALRDAAAARGPVIVVDNGDAFGGASALRTRRAHTEGGVAPCDTLGWLARLGAAATTLGNHDLDGGLALHRARFAQAPLPVLAANLRLDGAAWLPPHVTVATPFGEVGLTGALTRAALAMWSPELQARLGLDDPVEALVTACAALRPRCRLVVALAHFGLPLPPFAPAGPTLAEENPGDALLHRLGAPGPDGRPLADVVVLGHTHVAHASVWGGRTAVLGPGPYGASVGRAVVPVAMDRGDRAGDASAAVATVAAVAAPRAEILDLGAGRDAAARLAAAQGPEAEALRDEAQRDAAVAAEGLAVPADVATFAEQLFRAASARLRRAGLPLDGVVMAARVGPEGPPVRTLGEALARAPMLEPLVVVALRPAVLAATRQRRQWHAAQAEAGADPRLGPRHRWHAFVMHGPLPGPGAPDPDPSAPRAGVTHWLVPATWAAGYGGYDALGRAPKVAEPGLSLVEFLE